MPFFHTMENVFAIFPHNGKLFSTLWKTFEKPFPPQRAQSAAENFSSVNLCALCGDDSSLDPKYE